MRLPEPSDQRSQGRWRYLTDPDAFTEVFRQFHAPLVRYAHGFTGDAMTAEDVVQDVFAKLWDDREQIAIEVSLKALLYTMVRNRSLNANRRRQRIASDVAVEDACNEDAAEPSSEEALAVEELRKRLYRWIKDLAPRRREAFMLSRYHALKHSEIATIMGVSKRTVDTHILLALRELRDRLDELHAEG